MQCSTREKIEQVSKSEHQSILVALTYSFYHIKENLSKEGGFPDPLLLWLESCNVCVHVLCMHMCMYCMCVQLHRQARLQHECLYRKLVEDKRRPCRCCRGRTKYRIVLQVSMYYTYMHWFIEGGREVGQVWGMRTFVCVFVHCL